MSQQTDCTKQPGWASKQQVTSLKQNGTTKRKRGKNSIEDGAKTAKKVNRPLDFDLLRSSFQFLDRKQLSTLSVGSSQRIHSLIKRKFGNIAPYFVFEKLHCEDNSWKYEVNEEECIPSNQEEFLALLTRHKLIRSRVTYILFEQEIAPDFLKSISHVWAGQELIFSCLSFRHSEQVRPLPELHSLISTSAGVLILAFPGAFSVLDEPFIINDRYKSIHLINDTLYNPSVVFPYVTGILEFIFSSDGNSFKQLHMNSCLSHVSIEHRAQIATAIKQRFLITANILNFDFTWGSSGTEWDESHEIIRNPQTKQHLVYTVNTNLFMFRTLNLGTNADDEL